MLWGANASKVSRPRCAGRKGICSTSHRPHEQLSSTTSCAYGVRRGKWRTRAAQEYPPELARHYSPNSLSLLAGPLCCIVSCVLFLQRRGRRPRIQSRPFRPPFLRLCEFALFFTQSQGHYEHDASQSRVAGDHKRGALCDDLSTLLYSTLLYFTLLYFTLLYFTLLYFTLLYFTLLHSTLLYSTLLYSTLLYFTLLYFTLLYPTLLYSTLLYSTLLYSTLLCSHSTSRGITTLKM